MGLFHQRKKTPKYECDEVPQKEKSLGDVQDKNWNKSTHFLSFIMLTGKFHQKSWVGYGTDFLSPDYWPLGRNGIRYIEDSSEGDIVTFVPWHQLKAASHTEKPVKE